MADDDFLTEKPKGFSIPNLFNGIKDKLIEIWDGLSEQLQKIVKIAAIALLGLILILIIIGLLPKSNTPATNNNTQESISGKPAGSRLDLPVPRPLELNDLDIPNIPKLITQGEIIPAYLPKQKFSSEELDKYSPDYVKLSQDAIKAKIDAEKALILADTQYLLK